MTERDRQIWRAALTFANNICVQISDKYNADDDIASADASSNCAKRISYWINIDDTDFSDILSDADIAEQNLKQEALTLAENMLNDAVEYDSDKLAQLLDQANIDRTDLDEVAAFELGLYDSSDESARAKANAALQAIISRIKHQSR